MRLDGINNIKLDFSVQCVWNNYINNVDDIILVRYYDVNIHIEASVRGCILKIYTRTEFDIIFSYRSLSPSLSLSLSIYIYIYIYINIKLYTILFRTQ